MERLDGNLGGASAPITLDPFIGDPNARMRQLMAEGRSMEEAAEIVTQERWDAATAARPEGGYPMSQRNQAFEQNLYEATGETPPGTVRADPYQPTSMPAPVAMTPPGARDPFTNRAEAPAPIYTQEDLQAYERRMPVDQAPEGELDRVRGLGPDGSPYRGGDVLPSQEDMDMWARGRVRVVNPVTGESSWALAHTQADMPGAAGRRGTRNDLMQPFVNPATGEYVRRPDGTAAQKYSPVSSYNAPDGTDDGVDLPIQTPLGGGVDIYRPTPEFKAMLADREADQRLERLAFRAGMSYDDAKAILDNGGTLDDIRRRGNAKLQGEKQARQAEVVRRAQERYNPTALLDDDWQQFVIASRLLGRQAGASPSDIALAEQQAAAAVAARNNQNTINVTPTMQAAADQARMDSQAAIVQDAEAYVNQEFAWDNQGMAGFFASDYTPEEQAATVTYLMNKYGPPNGQMTQQQAQQIVDGIAARKRKAGGPARAVDPTMGF